jgi:hypothetical protein
MLDWKSVEAILAQSEALLRILLQMIGKFSVKPLLGLTYDPEVAHIASTGLH